MSTTAQIRAIRQTRRCSVSFLPGPQCLCDATCSTDSRSHRPALQNSASECVRPCKTTSLHLLQCQPSSDLTAKTRCKNQRVGVEEKSRIESGGKRVSSCELRAARASWSGSCGCLPLGGKREREREKEGCPCILAIKHQPTRPCHPTHHPYTRLDQRADPP